MGERVSKRRKRVLFLTWEYPPREMSPIARYCDELTKRLAHRMDVIVVTFDDWKANKTSFSLEENGLYVFYVKNPIAHTPSPLLWSLTLSSEMERVASDVWHQMEGKIDVIHANDWITLPSAIALKKAFKVPLVMTFHSIEPVRVKESDPYVEAIKKIEWQGTYDSDRIIVSNLWMKYQLMQHYGVPDEKIDVCTPDWEKWHRDVRDVYEKVYKTGRMRSK
jgi:hypothetical protein